MDFQSLKRRDLQALCKKNNIQANMTNAAMADALASLDTVEGIEEFLRQSESVGSESPERSVITSPDVPRTSTRQKATEEELEGSKLTTRTRCGTRRRAIEGTDARNTTTTRTSRRRAPQEASSQRKMEEDLQAKFEADLEQSDVSENNGLHGGESTETSEVSGVNVDEGGTQNELKDKVPQVNDRQESIEVNDPKDHMEENFVVIEAPQGSTEMFNGSQKVDFHSLSRKELQNLCKKNKIPANTTNAAMADALKSLESVEGLEELVKEFDFSAKSPEMSRMTSTRARQTRTCQKTTRRKPAYAGSALGKIETVQKKEDSVVQILAKKMDSNMEDAECPVDVSTGEDVQAEKGLHSHLEPCLEKSEVSDCVSEKSSSTDCEPKSEEVSDKSDTSVVVVESGRKLQDDVVGNKFDGEEKQGTETEACDFSEESVAIVNTDDKLKPIADQFPADVLGQKESNLLESDDASEIEGDGQEVNAETFEEGDTNVILGSDTTSFDEANVDKGLMQEAPEVGNKGVEESDNNICSDLLEGESRLEGDDGKGDDGLNSENLEQLGDSTNEIDARTFDVMTAEDSNVAEDFKGIVKIDGCAKPMANCATGDENLKYASAVVEFPNEAQQSSSLEVINVDTESEHCQQELEKPFIADAVAQNCPVEKLEGSQAEGQTANTFDSESTTEADQVAPKVKGTPLCHKSMRKLKRMLKEKLQEKKLADKMEKLTLDESDIPLGSNDSDAELTKEVVEFAEMDKASDGLAIMGVSVIDDVPVPAVISGAAANDNQDEESEDYSVHSGDEKAASILKHEAQCPVDIIQDNEISVAFVVGPINVESVNSHEAVPKESDKQMTDENFTCPQQVTPSKSSRKTLKPFTPSKTPMSRTNCVLDVNKENIDKSANKTGTGKLEIAVVESGKLLSAMSMGKLKKEFKVLQQQSEKKRPALQSRPENQCPLASP